MRRFRFLERPNSGPRFKLQLGLRFQLSIGPLRKIQGPGRAAAPAEHLPFSELISALLADRALADVEIRHFLSLLVGFPQRGNVWHCEFFRLSRLRFRSRFNQSFELWAKALECVKHRRALGR